MGEAVVIPGTPLNNAITPNVVSIFNQTTSSVDDYLAQSSTFATPRMDQYDIMVNAVIASENVSPVVMTTNNSPRDLSSVHSRLFV